MIQPRRQPRKLRTVFAIKKDFSDTDNRLNSQTMPIPKRAVQSQLSYNDVELMKSRFRVPHSLNKRQSITPQQLYEYNKKRTRYSYEDYFKTLDSDIVFPDLGIEQLEGFENIKVRCKSINASGNLVRLADFLGFECKKLDLSGNHINNQQIAELLARLIILGQQLCPPDITDIVRRRSTIGTVAGSECLDSSIVDEASRKNSHTVGDTEDDAQHDQININIVTEPMIQERIRMDRMERAQKELQGLEITDPADSSEHSGAPRGSGDHGEPGKPTQLSQMLLYSDDHGEKTDDNNGNNDEQGRLATMFQLTQPDTGAQSQPMLLSPQRPLGATNSTPKDNQDEASGGEQQSTPNLFSVNVPDSSCTIEFIKQNLDKQINTIRKNFPLFTSVQELDLSENDFDDLVVISWFIKLFGSQLVKLGMQHVQFYSHPDNLRSQNLDAAKIQSLTFSQKKRLKTNDTEIDHLVNSPVQEMVLQYQEEEDYDKPAVEIIEQPILQSNINIQYKDNKNNLTSSGSFKNQSKLMKGKQKLHTINEQNAFGFLLPDDSQKENEVNADIETAQDMWKEQGATSNGSICQLQLSDSIIGPGLLSGLSLIFPNVSIIQLNGVKANPDILPVLCSFKRLRSLDVTDSANIRKVDVITSFLVNNIQRLKSLETIIAVDSTDKDPKVMSKRPDKVYYHIDQDLTIYNNAYTLAKNPIHSQYFQTSRIITCELFQRKAQPGKKLSALQYSNKLLNNIAVLSNNSLLNTKLGETQTIRQMTEKEAKQLFSQSSMEVIRQVHSGQNQINVGSSQTYVQPELMETSFKDTQPVLKSGSQGTQSLGPTATQLQLKKYMDEKHYILRTAKLAVGNNRRTFIMNGLDEYRLFLKQQLQIYESCEPVRDALNHYFKQAAINTELMDSAIERNSILFQIKNIAELRARAQAEVQSDQFYLTAVAYSENMEENELLPYCKLNYNLENIMDFNDTSLFSEEVLSHLQYQDAITGPMTEDELRLFPIDVQGLDKVLVDKGASNSKALYKALQQVLEAPNTYTVDLMDDEMLKCLFEK